MMAKRIIHDGPVNTAVMAWMRGQGIKPEDVRGYTLTYDAGNLMTIDIRMYMEDVAPADFAVDAHGDVWRRDPVTDKWSLGVDHASRSWGYVVGTYGLADPQPPHATCRMTSGYSDASATYACSAACPSVATSAADS